MRTMCGTKAVLGYYMQIELFLIEGIYYMFHKRPMHTCVLQHIYCIQRQHIFSLTSVRTIACKMIPNIKDTQFRYNVINGITVCKRMHNDSFIGFRVFYFYLIVL